MSPVEKVAVTLGNVHDGNHGEEALPDDPGNVYLGHRGQTFANAVQERGSTLQMMGFRVPEDPEERRRIEERMTAHNRHVHRIRAGIENIFGTPFPRPPAHALAGSCPGPSSGNKVMAGRVAASGVFYPLENFPSSCICMPHPLVLKEKCHNPSGFANASLQKR